MVFWFLFIFYFITTSPRYSSIQPPIHPSPANHNYNRSIIILKTIKKTKTKIKTKNRHLICATMIKPLKKKYCNIIGWYKKLFVETYFRVTSISCLVCVLPLSLSYFLYCFLKSSIIILLPPGTVLVSVDKYTSSNLI